MTRQIDTVRLFRIFLLLFILEFLCVARLIPVSAETNNQMQVHDCISISSDSNGVGQSLVQIPPDGTIGLIHVHPLWAILKNALQQDGLKSFLVKDRSLTAASLSPNAPSRIFLPGSKPYEKLLSDNCAFIILGPYLDDTKVGIGDYMRNLSAFVASVHQADPQSVIFVLQQYQPSPAPWVVSDLDYTGFSPNHISEIQANFDKLCQPNGTFGQYRDVICVPTQLVFADLQDAYIMSSLTRDQYQALVESPSNITSDIVSFFNAHPTASLIGDGYHLSLVGRLRLMDYLAVRIKELQDF